MQQLDFFETIEADLEKQPKRRDPKLTCGIPYYGGKQKIAAKVIKHLPKHTVYVEPFCGGIATMIKKGLPVIIDSTGYREIINDLDSKLINFYEVVQDPIKSIELFQRLGNTLYSREKHKTAREYIYGNNDILDAYNYVIATLCSFSNIFNGAFGTAIKGQNESIAFYSNKIRLKLLTERLKLVTIENDDALKVIKRYDAPWTCFYCDPPYPGTAQDYNCTYTQQDFEALIDLALKSKGSFVISAYPNSAITSDFEVVEFTRMCAVSRKKDFDKKRTEVLAILDRSDTVPEKKRLSEYLWCPSMGDAPLGQLEQ